MKSLNVTLGAIAATLAAGAVITACHNVRGLYCPIDHRPFDLMEQTTFRTNNALVVIRKYECYAGITYGGGHAMITTNTIKDKTK